MNLPFHWDPWSGSAISSCRPENCEKRKVRTQLCVRCESGQAFREVACRGTGRNSQLSSEIPRLVQSEVWIALVAFMYRKNNKPEALREELAKKLYHSACWSSPSAYRNDDFNSVSVFVVVNAIITHGVKYFLLGGYKKDWLCMDVLKLVHWVHAWKDSRNVSWLI